MEYDSHKCEASRGDKSLRNLLPAHGWSLQAWKATSVSPLQSPTRPSLPSILLLLVLEPGPQEVLHPPQPPQLDHWQESPGKGEQKSQSPLGVGRV